MDAGGDRLQYSSNIAFIREVYDSEYAHQVFALELEKALDAGCSVIVIEPTQLGEDTAQWITVGNCLHKTAVFSGLASLTAGFIWPDRPLASTPLAALSFLCTSLYTASWQFDNCVKYQVEKDPRKLTRLLISSAVTASSPVVLVRKDNRKSIILHCTVSFAAAAFCAYRLYCTFK
ncbi:transmembrane protein 11 homolog, mitochondrial-like [Agrilus planipennis]|uniref:Transmembrane protein 11 homolog, mitochondrial n=1 Tax=Agrilus planipennis TaxID=224129 RepID=A0A1W4WL17_AGRPL|nr:transmembrane protein 11 homolog, mitochondrial [Agrilus planipennis]XP_025829246.1 transmembrane protein 11 homolog, mitochondrial-like [Agrilus planipennis]